MAADRHTRITVETERILMIARQHAVYGWCERCGLEVELLPSAQASHLLHLAEERLHGQQQGKLHLEQAKDGLVVCLKSLLRLLQAASGQHNSQ
jgi:hypothetical protein